MNMQNELQQLLQQCYHAFGVSLDDPNIQTRQVRYVFARHAFCQLAKDRLPATHIEIAQAAGYRNHASVLHSQRAVRDLLDSNNRRFASGWKIAAGEVAA